MSKLYEVWSFDDRSLAIQTIIFSTAIPHKNSETALIFHPFLQQSRVGGVLGNVWRENDHLDTTLLCRGGGIEKQYSIRSFSIGLNIFCEGLSFLTFKTRLRIYSGLIGTNSAFSSLYLGH